MEEAFKILKSPLSHHLQRRARFSNPPVPLFQRGNVNAIIMQIAPAFNFKKERRKIILSSSPFNEGGFSLSFPLWKKGFFSKPSFLEKDGSPLSFPLWNWGEIKDGPKLPPLKKGDRGGFRSASGA
jgi:hypothetical protein